MTGNNVSLDLMEFIEGKILPKYSEFDKAHNIEHVTKVIRSSMKLARQLGTDINMSYAIAAYHDIGMSGPRALHHINGGKILQNDMRLRKWFSPAQIKIMKEARIIAPPLPMSRDPSMEESWLKLTETFP